MTNNLPRVIALSGHRRAGKDTVANHLIQEYGFTRAAFADYLKEYTSKTYNLPLNHMHDQALKEAPILSLPVIPTDPFTRGIHHMLRDELKNGYWTPRALLILEGSIKRAVHSNFWVQKVIKDITSEFSRDLNFVITDLRYLSEIDTLRMFIPDIVLIRVHRPGNIITTSDPSERDLDSYPFSNQLVNGGTIEELQMQIDNLLRGNI